MRIISFIVDLKIIKKILKHLDLWDVRLKPPPCANSPPTEAFIIYDKASSPGPDVYIFDGDRTTLRLSTGYPIETYLVKKSASRHTGNLCPKLPKWSIPTQKIGIDNNTRFRYQVEYRCPLVDASICGASAEADIQSSIFGSSA